MQNCVKALSDLLMKLDSEGENSQYIQQIEALMSETVCPMLHSPRVLAAQLQQSCA